MTDPVRILVKRDELTLEVNTISALCKMPSKVTSAFDASFLFFCFSTMTGYKAIFCCRRKRRVEVWHFMWSLWYSYYHSSCYFLQHETKGNGWWKVLILIVRWTVDIHFTLNAQIWDQISYLIWTCRYTHTHTQNGGIYNFDSIVFHCWYL